MSVTVKRPDGREELHEGRAVARDGSRLLIFAERRGGKSRPLEIIPASQVVWAQADDEQLVTGDAKLRSDLPTAE